MRSNRNIYACGRENLHKMAADLGVPSVEPDVGVFLEFFCRSLKPGKILEIGCGVGVSSIYMAEGAEQAEITSVDHNRARLEQAAKVLINYKNIRTFLSDGAEYMKNCRKKFDLIFIDSVKKDYPLMFYYAEKLLNEGGVIIFDDVFAYGYIFCEDCEIPDKFRYQAQVLRDFLEKIKNTEKHSILPIGGGVLLVYKQRKR